METDSVETPMQVETDIVEENGSTKAGSDVNMISTEAIDLVPSLGISLGDLELLADLFYLPFSHGPTALKALELGHWLRDNSHLAPTDNHVDLGNKWSKKFAELLKIITNVSQLREKIQRLPHPGVVYDLAPYLTDINSVFAMILDYFRWLENGVMANRNQAHLKRLLTWFSPGYSEMTMSGDHEPWMFRGGLITELQRILPLESAQDLFPAPSRVGPTLTTTPAGPLPNPWVPEFTTDLPPIFNSIDKSSLLDSDNPALRKVSFQPRRPYILRPYRPEDKPKIYALWRRILLRRLGLLKDALPEKYMDLPGDRYCFTYLERFPQHCLVAEGPPLFFDSAVETPSSSQADSSLGTPPWDIVAFALAAPDIGALTRDRDELRRSQLRAKYPKDSSIRGKYSTMPRKPSINSSLHQLSAEDFIKISLDWIHDERTTKASSSVIAEAAVTEAPPPEPLGAAISDQLAGIPPQRLQQTAAEGCYREEKPFTVKGNQMDEEEGAAAAATMEDAVSDKEKQTLARSKRKGEKAAELVIESGRSVDEGLEQLKSGPRTVEAIHSALMAHPASIFVELDDCSFSGGGGGSANLPVTPATIMNHHLGLGFDPPELVLDEVARRLFVCLLAGLKTCASHGVHVELDTINETRADLYRRFGFYPVTAASTDFITVLGRLI
uniref:DUF4771 domain-containing protein n=1 Tax=Mesocestoides corti TaxID=53468 RepID=A0A5K3EU73_MESCO